jgi:hypothetical protein
MMVGGMSCAKRALLKLLILAFVFVAANAFAACREAVMPELPNSDLASEYEMQIARLAVDEYLADQELYLACVSNVRLHNQAVDRMRHVANQYNRSAKRFKARMQSMDMYTELVLLDFSR